MTYTIHQVECLQQILSTEDYSFLPESQEIVFSMSGTDWTCHNVMTFDGTDVIQQDDDGEYYITGDITDLPEGDAHEDDIVTHYNDDEDWDGCYQQLSENNIVWVHEVHTGTLMYCMETKEVYSGENTRYCSPQAFVMKDGVLCPLETR
jgi:hypothetical protein